MARQVRPEIPNATNTPQYKVSQPDWSEFEKLGDAQIKAANENYKLYAQALLNSESAKAYEQFKNDPINLSNALAKLPEMISDLPDEVQTEINKKFYLNSVSLVERAQHNQDKLMAEELKRNALQVATDTGKSIANDYFNVLSYYTAPEDQRRIVDLETYATNRVGLAEMADMKDADGNYMFTEAQQKMMRMPSSAILDGFKQFIYRADLKQLQKWDSDVFQNRDKFIKDTAIDSDIYDSMEKALIQRIKQLKDTDTRKIKTQAMIETAELLKDATNKTKIEELSKNANAPKKLVDRAVKLNEEIIKSKWYDPNRSSDPTGVFEMLATMGEIANDPDTSPDGLEKKIEKGLNVIDYTVKNLKQTNMSDGDLKETMNYLVDGIVDQSFINNVQMLDVSPWIQGVVDSIRTDMELNPAQYGEVGKQRFESELEAYHEKGKLAPVEESAKEWAEKSTWTQLGGGQGKANMLQAHKNAYENAKYQVMEVMQYLRATGDVQGAKNMLNQAKYNYVKTYNSNWIASSDFDRMQSELDSGKTPTYFYNGILWKYNGYQNDGAIFEVKL
jgi:hypothetical protein